MTRRTKIIVGVSAGLGFVLAFMIFRRIRRRRRTLRRRNPALFEEEVRAPDGDTIYARVDEIEDQDLWLTTVGRANEDGSEARVVMQSWPSEDEALEHAREAVGEEGEDDGEANEEDEDAA